MQRPRRLAFAVIIVAIVMLGGAPRARTEKPAQDAALGGKRALWVLVDVHAQWATPRGPMVLVELRDLRSGRRRLGLFEGARAQPWLDALVSVAATEPAPSRLREVPADVP